MSITIKWYLCRTADDLKKQYLRYKSSLLDCHIYFQKLINIKKGMAQNNSQNSKEMLLECIALKLMHLFSSIVSETCEFYLFPGV